MKNLQFEKMGMERNDGVLNNHRSRTIVITKDGRLMVADVGSYCKYYYRTTNKRTGAPLKNGIYEIENANALWIDGSIERAEAWPSDGHPYMACYGIGANMRKQLEGLSYTAADILKAFEIITGQHYDDIEIIDRVTEPAEYEAIKKRAFQEVKENYIEKKAAEIARDFASYAALKGITQLLNKSIKQLEEYSGTTDNDIKRIEKQVASYGGWREKNYISSSRRAVVSLGRNNLYRVYNLMPDQYGNIHYFEITKDGRITG